MIAKVYVFELKDSKELYAYTTSKKRAKRFLKERDKKCFHYYVLDLNKLSEKEQEEQIMKITFDGSYNLEKIVILNDGKTSIPILMTVKELNELWDAMEEIMTEVENTYINLKKEESDYFQLTEKEWKTIYKLTEVIRTDNISEDYFKSEDKGTVKLYKGINSFKIFYELFGFTMDKDSMIENLNY